MSSRTVPTDTPTIRCDATEGAQQCIKAKHPKIKGHTWGPRGEMAQWNDDGTLRTADQDAPTVEISRVDPDTQAAELVKAAANHSNGHGNDRDFADLVQIVERAEADRQHAALRRFEGHALVDLFSAIKKAKAQAAGRQLVDPQVIRDLLAMASNWASQRGVLEENGS